VPHVRGAGVSVGVDAGDEAAANTGVVVAAADAVAAEAEKHRAWAAEAALSPAAFVGILGEGAGGAAATVGAAAVEPAAGI
jgi:hypothetical protein